MTKRPYHAPSRIAAAGRTRTAILEAAKARFESFGWAGTTIAAVAADAGVSPKTIEAQFRTKAGLLSEVVAFTIRVPGPVEAANGFKDARDAIAATACHAAYATPLSARSARIAWAVEAAAPQDEQVAAIAERMRRNRRYGAHWAAEIMMRKRGLAADVTFEEAERVFRFAIDPATYRTLTGEVGLDEDGVEAWMARFERGMLLLRP